MVDTNSVLNTINGQGIMFVYGGIFLIAVAVIGLITFFLLKRKRYNIKCVLFSKDGFGNTITEIRRGGVIFDAKTKHKRFWFSHLKSFTIDDSKVRIVNEYDGKKIIPVAYFNKKSDVEIVPIEWDFNDKSGVMAYPSEHDANWMTTADQVWKDAIYGQSWTHWLPLFGMVFCSVLIFVLMYLLLQKMQLYADIANNMNQAAQALKEAALTIKGGLPSGSIIK